MSAHLIDNELFEQIASQLAEYAENSNNTVNLKYLFSSLIREYLGYGSSCFDAPDNAFPRALKKVRALYVANLDALSQLYKDYDLADTFEADMYVQNKRTWFLDWTPEQLIKNLDYVRYQLNEGSVNKEPIYLALEKLVKDLCHAYVVQSIGYDKAKWGK